jgi:hypothetical protein
VTNTVLVKNYAVVQGKGRCSLYQPELGNATGGGAGAEVAKLSNEGGIHASGDAPCMFVDQQVHAAGYRHVINLQHASMPCATVL